MLSHWVADAATDLAPALDACRSARDAERRLAERASDPACPAVALDRLRAQRVVAAAARAEALAPLYAEGLRLRVGTFLVPGYFDRAVYDVLKRWCGTVPGISVCSRCSRVFEPQRKGHASVCGPCHAYPAAGLPLRWDDNGCVYGFRGEVFFRIAECERCGDRFVSRRADARYCGDACRKGAARASPLPAEVAERQDALAELHAFYAEHPDYAEAVERGTRSYFAALAGEVLAHRDELLAAFPNGPYDEPGYTAPEPRRRERACTRCGTVGPWLQVCGPCGDARPWAGPSSTADAA